MASATKTEQETVAIKSVSSNRFCRLNRDEGDTNSVATTKYTIICDGSAKYTGQYFQDRFNNQDQRTSFLAFVFSLVPSERDGEFTLQAWALNNSTFADGTTLHNQKFAVDHKCARVLFNTPRPEQYSSRIVCSNAITEATVFQIESQGAGLYTLTAIPDEDAAFGVRNPGALCGTNSADWSVGCPAHVNVSETDPPREEEAKGFNAQFVVEVLAPNGQTFHGGTRLHVGEVMRVGGPPLVSEIDEKEALFLVLPSGDVAFAGKSVPKGWLLKEVPQGTVVTAATVELDRVGRVLFRDDQGNVKYYSRGIRYWSPDAAQCDVGYLAFDYGGFCLATFCKNGTRILESGYDLFVPPMTALSPAQTRIRSPLHALQNRLNITATRGKWEGQQREGKWE